MKKISRILGMLIIGSAIIWAAIIVGCSSALSGTECYDNIKYILSGGVIAHILLIWGPAAVIIRKIL